MSTQLALAEFLPPADVAIFRAENAEAIRVLGKRVASDIIEIGQRLIAVRKTCTHGEWLPWLDHEFGWKEVTAWNYMQVAERFKSSTVEDLLIDAGALYLLAGPSAPEVARVQAIEQAEAGERITKDKAKELIDAASHDAVAKAAAEWREGEQRRRDAAVRQATEALAGDVTALKQRVLELQTAEHPVDIEAIERLIREHLGIKKLSDDQWRYLAQILDTRIVAGNKGFDPVPKETLRQNEENLTITGGITRALQTLAGAPSPQSMVEISWPAQRAHHRELARSIATWLLEYADLLDELPEEFE